MTDWVIIENEKYNRTLLVYKISMLFDHLYITFIISVLKTINIVKTWYY